MLATWWRAEWVVNVRCDRCKAVTEYLTLPQAKLAPNVEVHLVCCKRRVQLLGAGLRL